MGGSGDIQFDYLNGRSQPAPRTSHQYNTASALVVCGTLLNEIEGGRDVVATTTFLVRIFVYTISEVRGFDLFERLGYLVAWSARHEIVLIEPEHIAHAKCSKLISHSYTLYKPRTRRGRVMYLLIYP